jgi:polysaccharide export outer membrane protein
MVALSAGYLLLGCSSTLPPAAPGITRLSSEILPAPTRADLASSTGSYSLGAYDEIRIDVFGIASLSNQNVQIDTSGRISFPLAGTIEVAGKTPAEVAAILQTRLRAAYVRNPQVTVNLTKIVSQVVTVEGEVREPGIYPIFTNMTLLKAVASAKGTTEFSKLNDVVVFRTVEGKSYAALYNLRAIRDGGYEDPKIYSGDVVMVGESRGRRLFRDFLQIAPLLSTPIIVALQN